MVYPISVIPHTHTHPTPTHPPTRPPARTHARTHARTPSSETMQKYCACHTKRTFDTMCRHVSMSRRAMPARQNDIDLFVHLRKLQVLQLPHRCSDATRKPGNRNETCWNLKRAFRARLPENFTLCSYKIALPTSFLIKPQYLLDVSCEAFTSHKMPRLPRNLHVVTT